MILPTSRIDLSVEPSLWYFETTIELSHEFRTVAAYFIAYTQNSAGTFLDIRTLVITLMA